MRRAGASGGEGVSENRFCRGCQQTLAPSEFWRRQSLCKTCSREHVRRYRAEHPGYAADASRKWSEKYPGRASEQTFRWRAANTERVRIAKRAQARIKYEIATGKMLRGSVCEQCCATDCAIEAAHVDYSKPLEVLWLCRPCHRRFDNHDPKALKSLASGQLIDAEEE
jgi:hypothetical protein